MNDFKTLEDTYCRYIAAQTNANDRNREKTFEALASEGITRMTVTFDGSGDSGQIEAVTAFIGDTEAALPPVPAQIEHVSWGSSVSTATQEIPLQQAIECLCYGYLTQMYDGWENNDGAFGEFTFDVAKRSIAFEFNSRFTDHSTDTHTL